MDSMNLGERGGTTAGWVAVLVLIATTCTSCAHLKVSASGMLGQVRKDEIAALDTYQGNVVQVTGVVAAKGLRNFEETTIESTTMPGFFGGASTEGEVRTSTHQRAFVSLDGEAEDGDVVCFFNDANRKAAASVKEGDHVSLQGSVYRLKHTRKNSIVFMDDCDVLHP